MRGAARVERMAFEQDRRISEVVEREQSRLLRFIKRRVGDPSDAEDLLQDVFAELVEANRLLMPIEHVTGWLFRVARNRITDLFRKRRPERLGDVSASGADDDPLWLEDLLPAPDAGPEGSGRRSGCSRCAGSCSAAGAAAAAAARASTTACPSAGTSACPSAWPSACGG